VYRKARDISEPRQERQDILERPVATLKLTDQYLGLLVAILTNAGLCEVCVHLSKLRTWIYGNRPLLPCSRNQRLAQIYLGKPLY